MASSSILPGPSSAPPGRDASPSDHTPATPSRPATPGASSPSANQAGACANAASSTSKTAKASEQQSLSRQPSTSGSKRFHFRSIFFSDSAGSPAGASSKSGGTTNNNNNNSNKNTRIRKKLRKSHASKQTPASAGSSGTPSSLSTTTSCSSSSTIAPAAAPTLSLTATTSQTSTAPRLDDAILSLSTLDDDFSELLLQDFAEDITTTTTLTKSPSEEEEHAAQTQTATKTARTKAATALKNASSRLLANKNKHNESSNDDSPKAAASVSSSRSSSATSLRDRRDTAAIALPAFAKGLPAQIPHQVVVPTGQPSISLPAAAAAPVATTPAPASPDPSRSASRHTPTTVPATATTAPSPSASSAALKQQFLPPIRSSSSVSFSKLVANSFTSSPASSSSSSSANTPLSTYQTSSSSPSSFYFSSSSSSSSASSSYASSFTSPSNLLRAAQNHTHGHNHHHHHHGHHHKDPFYDEFKTLDSDYSRFCSKSGVNKANVLRLSLLSFLRQQCGEEALGPIPGDPSSAQPTAGSGAGAGAAAASTATKSSGQPLTSEDAAKRLKIFHKWWTGILNALKDKDKPVPGSDRSAYLEAISGILARREWVYKYNECVNASASATATSLSGTNTTGGSKNGNALLNSHRLIFESLLCETLNWVLAKLSLKNVPISMAAFAGKVIAYAFFYAPGVAAPLLYLLRVTPLTVDRILRVSFPLEDQEPSSSSSNADMKLLVEATCAMRPFFPKHVSNLVGYTYGSATQGAMGGAQTPPATNSAIKPSSSSFLSSQTKSKTSSFRPFHSSSAAPHYSTLYQAAPQQSPQVLPLKFNKYTSTNVFAVKPPVPAQVPDIYGPWIRRWTSFNSDVFFSFLKHYYTVISTIVSAAANSPLNKLVQQQQQQQQGQQSHPRPVGSNGPISASPTAAHTVAPGLMILHAFILHGLDSVIHPRKPAASSASSAPPFASNGSNNYLRMSVMT